MSKALRRVTLLAGLLLSGLLACTIASAADSERTALEAAIHRWVAAVNAQDVAALTATMTEDVELSGNAATVTGRAAVIPALLDGTPGKLVTKSREITIIDDVAWHIVGLAQTQKNGDIHARGQALEIWKCVKGEWRLHRRMASGDLIPGALPTRPSTNEPVLDRPRK